MSLDFRRVVLPLVSIVVLGVAIRTTLGETKTPNRDGPSVSADLNSSRLSVQQPVSIHGPFPKILRRVQVGDLIQLQLSYPISPPFPLRATVQVSNRALSALWITSTDGEVAVLTPEPQQGMIGVGYFSVYLRANSPGSSTAKVTVTLADDTQKVVPFAFRILRQRDPRSDRNPRWLDDTIKVYSLPFALSSSDQLTDGSQGGTKPMPIHAETMLLWVDLHPTARFAHATKYVLLSAPGVKVVDGRWWPVLNGKTILYGTNQATVLPPTKLAGTPPKDKKAVAGQIHVFIYPYELVPGDKLEDGPVGNATSFAVKSETLLVWMDLLPEAKFAHPTRYVLISASGIIVEDGQWWPVLNGRPILRRVNTAGVRGPVVLSRR
jgi:hypothetical protein